MFYELSQKFNKDIKIRLAVYAILSPIISLIQIILIPIIEIEGFTPDIVLIFVSWISLTEGRFLGTISGFYSGIILDAMSHEQLGINALIKTIVGFVAGSWFNKDKVQNNTKSMKFILIIAICSLVNNSVYYLLNMNIITFSWTSYFLQSIPASASYTSVFALLLMLALSRRNREF